MLLKHLTRRHLRPDLLCAFLLSSMLALAACGGGGGGDAAGGGGGSGPGPGPGPGPVEIPSPPLPPRPDPHWSADPVRIDDRSAAGDAGHPTLAAGPTGNVAAAWTQVHNGRVGIHGGIYDAATASWSEPVPLDDPEAGDAGRPALAVDSRGNVTAMWSQANGPGTSTVYARRYDAAQKRWGASEQVRTAIGAQSPVLVVDGADNLTAAWLEREPFSALRVVSSRFDQGLWSAPVPVSSSDTFEVIGDPVLAVHGSGRIVAVWMDQPLTGTAAVTINASQFDGAQWSVPVRIDMQMDLAPGDFSYAIWPALVADGLGHVVAAWAQTDLTVDFVASSRFDGEAWSAPTPIGTGSSAPVRLGADAAGNVTAIWDEYTPDSVHHLSSSRFSALDGQWSPPVKITRDGGVAQAATFSLAAQADGDLFAVWTGFTSRSTILASRYVAATDSWDRPQQIDAPAATGNASSPVVMVDAAGGATAVWVQRQDGRAVINSNRFE